MSDASNPYGYDEGLPGADDYRPEAVGSAVLDAGEPEQQYPKWGLESVPILCDDEDTGHRLIRRNGDTLAVVSDDYKLLPNERCVAAANEVARNLGAEPFHEFDGEWFIELDDHVFQDPDGRRVHALYAWNDPVEVAPGDEVQMGFGVHNSIDGSLGFSTGLFSFRHACANMVFMGVDPEGMNFDDRDVLAHGSRKHTSGMDVNPDALQARIENVLLFADEVTDAYRAWTEQIVTPEQAFEMFKRFPQKDLPEWLQDAKEEVEKVEEMESLDAEDDRTQAERKVDAIQPYIPGDETVWDSYNALSESLWHSESTGDRTKRRKMKQLHRVFEPAEAVR